MIYVRNKRRHLHYVLPIAYTIVTWGELYDYELYDNSCMNYELYDNFCMNYELYDNSCMNYELYDSSCMNYELYDRGLYT